MRACMAWEREAFVGVLSLSSSARGAAFSLGIMIRPFRIVRKRLLLFRNGRVLYEVGVAPQFFWGSTFEAKAQHKTPQPAF